MISATPFLDVPDIRRQTLRFRTNQQIFAQGDAGDSVMYIQAGAVRLAAQSEAGREVVVVTLGSGDFFGEGCMAGQVRRAGSATAITDCTIVVLKKARMRRLLHMQRDLAQRFITHVLATGLRFEAALVDLLMDQDGERVE